MIRSPGSSANGRPGTCSYASSAASLPTSEVASSRGVRAPAAAVAYAISDSCSSDRRSDLIVRRGMPSRSRARCHSR